VGHHGVQRKLDKLRRQGFRFEGMRALVKQLIEFCQKMSRMSPAIQATPFTIGDLSVWRTIDIDTIGPLPKDDYENEFVVVIQDSLS
jgi:hypothetical protein